MIHPSAEEWMAYLYGELPKAEKTPLQAHLQACPQCQQSVATWRDAMSGLAKWKLPAFAPRPAVTGTTPPALKWALAAALVLGLGYGLGRFSTPPVNAATRASLAAELKRQLQDEFQADWQAVLSGEASAINTDFRRLLRSGMDQSGAKTAAASDTEQERLWVDFLETYQANRQQDQQALLALLKRAEQREQLEHVQLRRTIETVAVVAADKFQRTDNELGHLASYTQAKFTADDADQPFKPVNQSNRKGN